MAEVYVPRLKQHYVDTVRPQLMEKFSYSNALQVPKFDKVVLNMGVGEAVGDGKIMVLPIEKIYRIRTGEEDQDAVTPVQTTS